MDGVKLECIVSSYIGPGFKSAVIDCRKGDVVEMAPDMAEQVVRDGQFKKVGAVAAPEAKAEKALKGAKG